MKAVKLKVKYLNVYMDCWVNPDAIAWIVQDEKKKSTWIVFVGVDNGWGQRMEVEMSPDDLLKLIHTGN
jgi:hypothetical protein